MSNKQDIRTSTDTDLQALCQEAELSAFRADQLYEWLWGKRAVSFEDMTNLSKNLRTLLTEKYVIRPAEIETMQYSNDKSIKVGFMLHDGCRIEGVLIPAGDDRVTACISSQVGCSLNCRFCATGYMERKRNVAAPEIFDQVWLLNEMAQKHYGRGLTNIVFMGMGEPLLNYKNMVTAIGHITHTRGMNISPKRITVSTVGIAKMIRKLADDLPRVGLALSLHAPNNRKRSYIMPINESNDLGQVMDAIRYYCKQTDQSITYEYILLKGINDSPQDARELAALCRDIPVKVNLIEYNPIAEADYVSTEEKQLHAFVQELLSLEVYASVRRSRGKDIDAACGQLANRQKAS